VGSALSVADIVGVLYAGVLRIDPGDPGHGDRDRFILSKGHATAALYAALAARGFFPREWLWEFGKTGGRLPIHPEKMLTPGVDFSTGSLGHGLGVGSGMALGLATSGSDARVYVVLSDGECNEGSTWEAAMFAGHHKLRNLTAIVDYNGLQALGRVSDVLDLEPFADKWRAFGWNVIGVNGNDIGELHAALGPGRKESDRPTAIIARTQKGSGVPFMEDKHEWHYISLDEKHYRLAMDGLRRHAESPS
jgi:transketolase